MLGDKDGGQGGKYEGGKERVVITEREENHGKRLLLRGVQSPPPCNGMDCTVRAYIKERDACTGN